MSLKRIPKFRGTLAFRLTIWYGAVFSILSIIAFLFFYLMITSGMKARIDQDLLKQLAEFTTIYNLEGLETLEKTAMFQSQAAGEKEFFFRLLYPSGVAFSSSNMSYWKDIGIDRKTVKSLMDGKKHLFSEFSVSNNNGRVRLLYAVLGKKVIIQLGRSMAGNIKIIETFQRLFFTTMSFLILTAVGVGWFMAKRALSGVEAVTETANKISETDLGQRVPLKTGTDEIDRLASTFNRMLDRIESLVTGIKEMSDNIAHDLKSPVTRIRGTAELALTTKTKAVDFKQMAQDTIESCDQLLEMINTMLMISRTESGANKIDPAPVDMTRVVMEACELFRPLAEEKAITLNCRAEENLMISGDKRLLQRMTANLLDNALKYTQIQGKVDISVYNDKEHKDQIVFCIQDTGVGISREDLSHVFDRFFRCDQCRSLSGTGLGLSLSRAIARAHKGDISVQSKLDQGTIFIVSLPSLKKHL